MKGRPPFLVRLISKPPLNKWIFKLLAPSDKSKALRLLQSIGHSKETLNSQPGALGDCYFYFRFLPHYLISLTSLLENTAPKINEQQLKTVSQPVLFLLGTKDTFASVETGRQIADAIPVCEFHTIQGAGHLPWLENPAECGGLINSFIKRR
jgi:2-hydroxy-6-oxonona-2,4-dienedioate hydrolase